MTKARALELADRLLAAGYIVRIIGSPPTRGHFRFGEDPDPRWSVAIAELGVDKVDLKALVGIADELGFDCGTHGLGRGEISFAEPDPTPEVVRNPRRHPR